MKGKDKEIMKMELDKGCIIKFCGKKGGKKGEKKYCRKRWKKKGWNNWSKVDKEEDKKREKGWNKEFGKCGSIYDNL